MQKCPIAVPSRCHDDDDIVLPVFICTRITRVHMHCLYLELTFSVSVGDTIMKIRHLRDRGDSSSVPRGYAAQILFVPRNKEGCKYLRETVCHYEFAIRDVEPDGLTLARSPRLMPRQPLVDFGPSPGLAIMVCHSRRYITVWQHGSYFSEKQGIFNSRTYKCSCLSFRARLSNGRERI